MKPWVALCLAGMGWPTLALGQAVSDSDFVRMDTVKVSIPMSGDTTFSLLVSLQTKTPAQVMVIPLSFAGNPNLAVDTTVVDTFGNKGVTQQSLGLNAAWWVRTSYVDNTNKTILLAYAGFGQPLGASTGSLVRIHLKLTATGTPDTIKVDSTFLAPSNQLSITDSNGVEWTPQFRSGTVRVVYQGPWARNLSAQAGTDPLHLTDHTPTIAWEYGNELGGPQTRYRVEVGTNTDWATAEMWNTGDVNSNSTSVTYSGSPLLDGVTYYYRVRVFGSSIWSLWAESSFRMNSVPGAPAIAVPTEGQVVSSLTPAVTVTPGSDAEGDAQAFTYQIYGNSGLTVLLASDSGLASPGWNTDSLPDNGRVWMRTRSTDSYEVSAWSSTRSFWVDGVPQAPTVAQLIAPTDGDTLDIYDSVLFLWHPCSDPDPLDSISYRLGVAFDAQFLDPLLQNSVTDTGQMLVNVMQPGNRYYWRVLCVDTRSGLTSVSAVRTFVTRLVGPSVLSVAVDPPQAQNHITDHTPVISWEYSQPDGFPQTQYEVQVGSDLNWATAELWQPGPIPGAGTSVVYAGGALTDGATYYYRVRAFGATLWSEWKGGSFRMNTVPGAPNLVSPLLGAVASTLTPQLVVNVPTDPEGDTLRFTFEVYQDSALSTLHSASAPQLAASWTSAALPDNTRAWWRARAADGYETGVWSATGSFWVDGIPQSPTAAGLMSPPNSGTAPKTGVLFRWHRSTDPDPFDSVYYRLYLASDSMFASTVAQHQGGDTTWLYTDTLLTGSRYFWRVRTLDTRSGDSATSATFRFDTATEGLPGDVNNSGIVSSADIIFLVNYVFKGGPAPVPLALADVNADCGVTSSDIIRLVNYVFKGGASPLMGCA